MVGRLVGSRRRAVLILLAVALATMVSSAPTWVRGVTSSALDAAVALTATGAQAAPGVTAGGLVVAAAALALALGRRVGTWLAAAGAVLGGVLVTVSAVGVPGRALDVLGAVAADRLGVGEVLEASVGPWPWLAAALGAAAAVVGLLTVPAARTWAAPSARHEGAAGATAAVREDSGPGDDPGATWDALSRGEDPT